MTTAATRPSLPSIPPVVVWLAVCSGAWLIYSAVRGLSPTAEIKAALTGAPSPGPKAVSSVTPTMTVSPAGAALLPAVAFDTSKCANPAVLVKIGQGNHSLIPQAAAALAAAEKAFGQQITVTDTVRTCERQAADHAKDPKRFGSAETSGHPRGICIDVNLIALKADPGKPSQEPTFRRLFTALTAAGFHNPRGPYDSKGDKKEPWHFSFGIRV